MYILDVGEESSEFLSSQNLTVVIHNTSLSMHEEEIYNSPITKKFLSEMHSMVQEEDHP